MTKKKPRYWSQRVTETSNAMDLEPNVFKDKDPRKIARSVKRSAERSRRRKSGPFRSAMSMIVFYANRAGKNLSSAQRRTLDRAKEELRRLFDKKSPRTRAARTRTPRRTPKPRGRIRVSRA